LEALQIGEGAPITWKGFMMAFMDRFFPLWLAKAQEFTDLVKGFMMEKQYYASKFVELLRFAPYLVPNEELKTQKFEKWLHIRILDWVAGFELKNVVDIINKAVVVERTLKTNANFFNQNKRSCERQYNYSNKKMSNVQTR
jgi:hypothetical protein